MSDNSIVEGIFAINKPPNRTSAQTVNRLKYEFGKSELFAPLANARSADFTPQHGRRKGRNKQFKIGHGGTLDPNATGVLIIGVGAGTKLLQNFLTGSTKTYEATVLFGAATDSYDTDGKVLKRAPYAHITRQVVEEALDGFRGKGTQRPPLYSALKMDGKRLCDYAREGREIPREIERRDVNVSELEVVEWLEGKDHDFEAKGEEADADSRKVAEAILHLGVLKEQKVAQGDKSGEKAPTGVKRKRMSEDGDDEDDGTIISKKPALEHEEPDPSTMMSGGLQFPEDIHAEDGSQSSSQDRPPAVKLRMTVSSGFYVRSLAHDLGEAVGSLACMCALVRTRQGDYELGNNALEFEDLVRGEDVWGPKVEQLIEDSKSIKDSFIDVTSKFTSRKD